jgi:hypothetical protein
MNSSKNTKPAQPKQAQLNKPRPENKDDIDSRHQKDKSGKNNKSKKGN